MRHTFVAREAALREEVAALRAREGELAASLAATKEALSNTVGEGEARSPAPPLPSLVLSGHAASLTPY